MTTPEAESDASAADILQRQRSWLQQRVTTDEVAESISKLKASSDAKLQEPVQTLQAALNFVALSKQVEGSGAACFWYSCIFIVNLQLNVSAIKILKICQ